MKKLLYILSSIFFLFCFTEGKSQDGNLKIENIKQAGGEGTDILSGLHITPDNRTIICGTFEDKALFDSKTLSSEGKKDAFIAEYNSEGLLLQTIHISGKNDVRAGAVTTDKDGNIYVCGDFRETCNFGTFSLTANRYRSNFVAKYASDGKLLWAKQVETDSRNHKSFLACDKDGSLYYAGSFYKEAKIDKKSIKSESSSDIFLAQFDTKGNIINFTCFGGSDKDIITDLVNTDTGILMTGSFKNKLNIGNIILESAGNEDGFTALINGTEAVWAKSIGGSYKDYCKKLTIYKDDIYLAGSFSGEFVFEGEEMISKGVLDAFVCRMDIEGNLKWMKTFGSKTNVYMHSIAISSKGKLYATTNFRGKIEDTKAEIESDNFKSDLSIIKLDINKGEIDWMERYGGKESDFPVAMSIDNENYIIIGGNYARDLQIGEQKIKSTTKNDMFFVKLYDCDNGNVLDLGRDQELCAKELTLKPEVEYSSYKWNTGSDKQELTVTSSGDYELTVTDKHGCTYSDEVNITLNEIPAIDIPLNQMFCKGTTLILDAGRGHKEYKWTDNSTGRKLKVYEKGEYTVKVTNKYACTEEVTVEVAYYNTPELNLGNDISVAIGESFTIAPDKTYSEYRWSDNSTEPVLTINTTGFKTGTYTYSLEASDNNGCVVNDEIQLKIVYSSDMSNKADNTHGGNNIVADIEQEKNFDNSIIKAEVYPNPSNGNFKLTLKNISHEKKTMFEVYSADGRYITSKQLSPEGANHIEDIKLQKQASGNYILKITNGDISVSKEIIIY